MGFAWAFATVHTLSVAACRRAKSFRRRLREFLSV